MKSQSEIQSLLERDAQLIAEHRLFSLMNSIGTRKVGLEYAMTLLSQYKRDISIHLKNQEITSVNPIELCDYMEANATGWAIKFKYKVYSRAQETGLLIGPITSARDAVKIDKATGSYLPKTKAELIRARDYWLKTRRYLYEVTNQPKPNYQPMTKHPDAMEEI